MNMALVYVVLTSASICVNTRAAPILRGYSPPTTNAQFHLPELETAYDEYLRTYGYLDDFSNSNAKDRVAANTRLPAKTAREAVSRLQAYANLNVTGVLDEPTLQLMRAPRCGLRDVDSYQSTSRVQRKRIRRGVYDKTWNSMHRIVWQWDAVRSDDLYRLSKPSVPYVLSDLQKAFRTWSNGTGAPFVQSENGRGDIRILFARSDHGCGYRFDGSGGVLAHAFYPDGRDDGKGGDIHFDSDETWSAGRSEYDGRSTSLFQVALHEIGHAIGLKHNNNPSSVMFPWYSTRLVNAESPHLPADDVLAFYDLYVDRYSDEDEKRVSTGKGELENRVGCSNGPYDDITYIGDEIFVLKNGKVSRWYNGRPMGGDKVSLSKYFEDLPKDKTVDAFHFDDYVRSIIIIIGDELFEYRMGDTPKPPLYRRVSVRFDLGVFSGGPVDTVFGWRSYETYMFNGRYYWELNVSKMRARYMGYIGERWPGMLDGGYDAAFSKGDTAYFVKNNWFWEVNMSTGMPLAYRQVNGNILPRCQEADRIKLLESGSAYKPVQSIQSMMDTEPNDSSNRCKLPGKTLLRLSLIFYAAVSF